MDKLVGSYQPKLYTEDIEAVKRLEQKREERSIKKANDPKWDLKTKFNKEGLLDPKLKGNEVELNVEDKYEPGHKRSNTANQKTLVSKGAHNITRSERKDSSPKRLIGQRQQYNRAGTNKKSS